MAIDCRGGSGWLKFETSDGQTHLFGKTSWGQDHEPKKPGGEITRTNLEGNRVIGIHGGLGGGLHNLGLVLQAEDKTKIAATKLGSTKLATKPVAALEEGFQPSAEGQFEPECIKALCMNETAHLDGT